ncbi:FAD binding domain-containing protein [Spirochaetia bacterium 38H-sp]|uniref:FAD binding domain-containing protein n=1 Tax=Rarispira pelagica TaxID=3141764 RepID=A0ABU9UCT5_9SPIR
MRYRKREKKDMIKQDNLQIYYPGDLQDALLLYNKRPEAILTAGSVELSRTETWQHYQGPVIVLGNIREIKRIIKTERYLEIGAGKALSAILSIPSPNIPLLLKKSILLGCPAPARTQATIGGNLCIPDKTYDIHGALTLLNATAEIRKTNHTRWIPVSDIRNTTGFTTLEEGEILTRIRIPISNWEIQEYIKFPGAFTTASINLYGLAHKEDNLISAIRISIKTPYNPPYRYPETEKSMIGKSSPLTKHEITQITKEIAEKVSEEEPEADIRTITKLISHFLQKI